MMHRSKDRIQGFGLMLAIFLLVTVAAVAAYLMTVSSGQLEAVTQDEQGARAYQAARTGIDWGAYQVLIKSACPATTTIPLPQAGLAGITFYAEVKCSTVGTETEAGTNITVYKIVSKGCNRTAGCVDLTVDPNIDPGPTYVERELALNLAK
jgi:MSHA biogenesis protein MshP